MSLENIPEREEMLEAKATETMTENRTLKGI